MMSSVKSGVPGFDSAANGGFVPNSVNLVTGGTGTGKSLFALHFLLNGARKYGDRGIYFTMEETEEELREDVKSVGLSYKEPSRNRKAKFVYCPLYETTNFPSLLYGMLEKFKPKRVVIDSISALTVPMANNFERRKQIYEIVTLLKSRGCTSILTEEVTAPSSLSADSVGGLSRFGITEFLCDSVTVLHYAGIGGESDRALQIVKMRRSNHARGPIPMSIGEQGVRVLKSKYK